MNEKITTAIEISELDQTEIDLPLLIGSLLKIKEWANKEKHLKALGKISICDELRKTGNKVLEDSIRT